MSTDIAAIVDAELDTSVSALEKVERTANPGKLVYSTIASDTFEGRIATMSAILDTEALSDHLGEVVNLKDFVLQVVEINDTESNQKIEAVRVILVDADGAAYHAVSDGVLNALQTITGALGHPSTWPNPVPVTPIEMKGRSGFRFMTLVPVK